MDEDPEYYKSLSLRLRDIIEKTKGKWDQQLELLLDLVSNIETEHKQAADDLGLTETEYAFYNILMAEVSAHSNDGVVGDEEHEEIKATSQSLVEMFDEATQIVDFFQKNDEVKRMKKEIKRAILDCSYGESAIVKVVQSRFMDLAQSRFGKSGK